MQLKNGCQKILENQVIEEAAYARGIVLTSEEIFYQIEQKSSNDKLRTPGTLDTLRSLKVS
ncbi:MAG: hypothetical protein IGS39_00325 [Calothrix sp. C42_A2020_038]|nr:hypothetical protein [Calothrix sp. C42_A2020_038]